MSSNLQGQRGGIGMPNLPEVSTEQTTMQTKGGKGYPAKIMAEKQVTQANHREKDRPRLLQRGIGKLPPQQNKCQSAETQL